MARVAASTSAGLGLSSISGTAKSRIILAC
jgi:hypothetical protein